MSRFTLPRDLYFGENALEELRVLRGKKRALIVTGGKSMKAGGFLQKLEHILKEAGLEILRFENVEPDPSVETVMRGAEAMREFAPDVIAAIGGGSAIDAAKAMWVFYEYPSLTFEEVKKPFSLPPLRQKAIFVAIPSTSGTATEVTAFSVVTDYSTRIKYPLADFNLTPDIAVLDPAIAATMPEKLAAHTGMDALTHAIEAYTATLHSDFSDPLALHAIGMICGRLTASVHGDREARGDLHIAQCLAGMAFSNALLGIVHSLAHKIGAKYELPHGECNAILLPYAIPYNARACLPRYAAIARSLGLPGVTEWQLTEALIRRVRELNGAVDIPFSFREAGVSEALFEGTLTEISLSAYDDPCTGSNPRATSPEELAALLRAAYQGTAVNF